MTLPLHLRQSEAEFQQAIIEYAQARGWLVHAERTARSDKGWRTPVQGDPGFPDLVLARREKVVIAELKTQKGVLKPNQRRWVWATDCYVWRPSDWPQIEEVLK